MRAQRWTRRVLILGQFMVLLLSPLSESAWPETYDSLVAMLHDPDSSVQIEGKERLALIIKKNLPKSELHYGPDQFTEDTFLFGHFINPNALDLAIGISVPAPRQGNLVVLTLKNGPYVPVEPVTGIGLIESLETVKLFPGPLDQLVLDMAVIGKEHFCEIPKSAVKLLD